MKFIFFLFILAIPVRAAIREKVLGLDSETVREKIPVVVYLGNDIMAPLNSMGLVKNSRYLKSGLSGEQTFLDAGKHMFTEEEVEAFGMLAPEDQALLKKVASRVYSDLSQKASGADSGFLERGICRKNPKYRAGLALVRNFAQPFPLSEERHEYRWFHCGGAEAESKHSLYERWVDVSSVGKSLYEFPQNEQPLTHAGFLKSLLKDVAEVFPPSEFRYLIVVQSNSQPGFVLSPQHPLLMIDHSIMDVRKAVLSRKALFLNEKGDVREDRGFLHALTQSFLQLVPKEKMSFGISAEEFLEMLQSEVPNLDVVAVKLDTNGLDLSNIPESDFSHVGRVFYNTDPAPAVFTFNWSPLFHYVGVQATDLEERFIEIQR